MAQSQVFTCPKCGAPQAYGGGTATTIQCPYCDTTLIVPPALRTGAADSAAFDAGDWAKEANALLEIKRLVNQNKKIEAIKLYRETFGTGLAESKDAVEAIARGQNVQVAQIRVGDAAGLTVTPSGSNLEITSSPGGITVSPSSASRSTMPRGCISALVAVIVLVIVGSLVLPLVLSDTNLFGMFGSNQPQISPVPIFVSTPPALAIKTPTPTVTSTPGWATVVNSFGKEGTGPGSFDDARYVAIGKDSNLYVGEYGSARIQRLDRDGKFQDQWMMAPKFPLRGLAADFLGNVYAVQQGVIHKYDGATAQEVGALDYPAGGEGFDDLVATANGGVVATWYEGRSGIITSTEGHRDDLVLFDRAGKVTGVIEGVVSSQTEDPELDNRVAVDGEGNLYVLGGTFDTGVFKYSPTGKFLNRFGSSGNEPGQFRSPLAIATDGKGRVYVSQSNDIMVFAPDGRYLDTFGDFKGAVFDMAFDPDDHLWLVAGNKVYELELNQ